MFQHPTPTPQDKAGQPPPQQHEQRAQHVPQGQPAHQQHIVHLSWSHFKPEFSVKPEEDAEAHLLCTNDWMNAHHFVENTRVQRFA